MTWHVNTCVNWCPLEGHPENSGHPVRYYCRYQCLGSSNICDCVFHVAAPTLWNMLLADIRNASSLKNLKSERFIFVVSLYSIYE